MLAFVPIFIVIASFIVWNIIYGYIWWNTKRKYDQIIKLNATTGSDSNILQSRSSENLNNSMVSKGSNLYSGYDSDPLSKRENEL